MLKSYIKVEPKARKKHTIRPIAAACQSTTCLVSPPLSRVLRVSTKIGVWVHEGQSELLPSQRLFPSLTFFRLRKTFPIWQIAFGIWEKQVTETEKSGLLNQRSTSSASSELPVPQNLPLSTHVPIWQWRDLRCARPPEWDNLDAHWKPVKDNKEII